MNHYAAGHQRATPSSSSSFAMPTRLNKTEGNKSTASPLAGLSAGGMQQNLLSMTSGGERLSQGVQLNMGCRPLELNYRKLNRIAEGTYGVVFRGQSLDHTQEVVALKQLKVVKSPTQGFPLQALREISILSDLNHPNIVRVHEVVVVGGKNKGSGSSGAPAKDQHQHQPSTSSGSKHEQAPKASAVDPCQPLSYCLVMEYLEHEVHNLLAIHQFKMYEIKNLVEQLMNAIAYLHKNFIVHRDIKTSNLLYSNRGGVLKLCDFGLARRFGEPIFRRGEQDDDDPHVQVASTSGADKATSSGNSALSVRARREAKSVRYTTPVCTLWYRPPELLLGAKVYDPRAVDVWSAGCVVGELIKRAPIFPASTEEQQIRNVFRVAGKPDLTTTWWKRFYKQRVLCGRDPSSKNSKSSSRSKKWPPNIAAVTEWYPTVGWKRFLCTPAAQGGSSSAGRGHVVDADDPDRFFGNGSGAGSSSTSLSAATLSSALGGGGQQYLGTQLQLERALGITADDTRAVERLVDFVSRVCEINPDSRLTASQSLQSSFLREGRIMKSFMMPTFPETNAVRRQHGPGAGAGAGNNNATHNKQGGNLLAQNNLSGERSALANRAAEALKRTREELSASHAGNPASGTSGSGDFHGPSGLSHRGRSGDMAEPPFKRHVGAGFRGR
ncbi:unnamed protein product [Amoebophrya sp. A25]|nr:unnamed protein product [Amoebophrya sp. A25]|eukprot:GSA25T00005966001.1